MGRRAALTPEQQTAVREALGDPGCKIKDLAELYGVDRATIRKYRPPSRQQHRVCALELTAQTFGRWTVIAKAARPATSSDHHSYWECWCECGVIQIIRGSDLIRGVFQECTDCRHAARTRNSDRA